MSPKPVVGITECTFCALHHMFQTTFILTWGSELFKYYVKDTSDVFLPFQDILFYFKKFFLYTNQSYIS